MASRWFAAHHGPVRCLGRHLDSGALDELTLTTNGSQLRTYAEELRDAASRRINVSHRHARPAKFAAITRWGELAKVIAGIEAAKDAGLAVKINAWRSRASTTTSSTGWSHGAATQGFDLTFIEVMPMGDIGADRGSTSTCRCRWCAPAGGALDADEIDYRTGGPARYVDGQGDRPADRLHHAAHA